MSTTFVVFLVIILLNLYYFTSRPNTPYVLVIGALHNFD